MLSQVCDRSFQDHCCHTEFQSWCARMSNPVWWSSWGVEAHLPAGTRPHPIQYLYKMVSKRERWWNRTQHPECFWTGAETYAVIPARETNSGLLCIEVRVRLYHDGAMSKLLEALSKVPYMFMSKTVLFDLLYLSCLRWGFLGTLEHGNQRGGILWTHKHKSTCGTSVCCVISAGWWWCSGFSYTRTMRFCSTRKGWLLVMQVPPFSLPTVSYLV